MGMLLGTDLPIFSSADHPAMALQLVDLSRPIRPLSILDFWLDNVMNAIPALAVCGHVDGMVKGYQVFRTDELPHWPGASFDEDAVLDNAHQLLSFLQGHCTRPGGSWWVLKEPEANVVRVFDLATLSAEYGADANPFAHSVALMCYRMALRCNVQPDGGGGGGSGGARDGAGAKVGGGDKPAERAKVMSGGAVVDIRTHDGDDNDDDDDDDDDDHHDDADDDNNTNKNNNNNNNNNNNTGARAHVGLC